MIVFAQRIRELSDMLDSECKGMHTSREISLFRDKYFEHVRELTPYSNKVYLEPLIDQYKYILYHANKSFRHDNDQETIKYLNKALKISEEIMKTHRKFQSYQYPEEIS